MTAPTHPLPCPACGFLVHDDVDQGLYLICPLCEWEDCAIQLANPLEGGGPNRESLVAWQAQALRRWPLSLTHWIKSPITGLDEPVPG